MKAMIAPRGLHLVLMLGLEAKEIEMLTQADEDSPMVGVIFLPLVGQAEQATALAMMPPKLFDLTQERLRSKKIPFINLVPEGGEITDLRNVDEYDVLIEDTAVLLQANTGLSAEKAREKAAELVNAARSAAAAIKDEYEKAQSEGAAPEGGTAPDSLDDMIDRVLNAHRVSVS